MELIKPQNEFITNDKHIKHLNILKKCIENSINKIYVVSKSLHAKKDVVSSLTRGKEGNEKEILNKIIYSIDYYSTKTA